MDANQLDQDADNIENSGTHKAQEMHEAAEKIRTGEQQAEEGEEQAASAQNE